MRKYDFDKIYDRKNTSSLKYDFGIERKGRDDLLPLWVADMDFRLPDEIISDIVKRCKHGIFGYTDPGKEYNEALNKWYSTRHDIELGKDWNTIAPGVVYAISTAIRAFTCEGDAVIIQQPVYYPFMQVIKLNNRRLVNNQLKYVDGKYSIDFENFEQKIITENVKFFILCSPHNPVGRVWSREELFQLADICLKHNVTVFSDEIHSDFVYTPNKFISFLSLGEEYFSNLIVGTSPSKTFNMAGLQVANIIIPDKCVRHAYRKENAAAGYSQGNAIGMVAAISAYDKGGEWLDELLEYLQGNLNYIRDFLASKLPKVHLVEPEGTYLVWLDFSDVLKDYKKLEHLIVDVARLWLDPGIIFGEETALFERVNIACPRRIIERAMSNLYEAFKEEI